VPSFDEAAALPGAQVKESAHTIHARHLETRANNCLNQAPLKKKKGRCDPSIPRASLANINGGHSCAQAGGNFLCCKYENSNYASRRSVPSVMEKRKNKKKYKNKTNTAASKKAMTKAERKALRDANRLANVEAAKKPRRTGRASICRAR
jgi:hypothetical protein